MVGPVGWHMSAGNNIFQIRFIESLTSKNFFQLTDRSDIFYMTLYIYDLDYLFHI